MKKLWLLFLLFCSLGAQAQMTPADSAAIHALISVAGEKTAAAAQAREAARNAAASILANAPPDDSAQAAAKLLAGKIADSLGAEAKLCEQQAAMAQAGVARLMGMNETPYPTPGGRGLAWTLIGLIMLLVSAIWAAIRRQAFSLKDAISENLQDKITIANPEYSAEKIKSWLADFSKPTLADFKAKLDAAEAALADAKAASSDPLTEDDKKKIGEATKQRDAALANYQSASSGPGPAALTGIARLFPPTIEVSSAAINYDAMARFIAARNTRLEEAARNPQDAAKLQAAQAAEEQAFAAMQTTGAPVYRASASRLIAFISAMLLFIVGVACSCFFLYFYLVNGVPPNLSRLPAILIALGIGMAPYAINKVSNAASSKDSAI